MSRFFAILLLCVFVGCSSPSIAPDKTDDPQTDVLQVVLDDFESDKGTYLFSFKTDDSEICWIVLRPDKDYVEYYFAEDLKDTSIDNSKPVVDFDLVFIKEGVYRVFWLHDGEQVDELGTKMYQNISIPNETITTWMIPKGGEPHTPNDLGKSLTKILEN